MEEVSRFVLAPGIYRRDDGAILRARMNRAKSSLYTEQWVRNRDTFEFAYRPDAIGTLRNAQRLSLLEAREISRQVGQCLACAALLTDLKSQMAGLGPTCEKNWSQPQPRWFRVVIKKTPFGTQIDTYPIRTIVPPPSLAVV